MAGNDITLGIAVDTKKAVDDISSFKATAETAFKAIAAVAAAAFASKALFSGIESVVSAANEQVDAINKMNQSLVASGDYSKAASENMVAFAKELSGIIAVDDDAILQSLALAKSFGATNEQATALVSAAADLSAAMGTDLDTAVTQLGGTLSGTAGKLTKVAPQLKELTEESLKAGDAIKILGDRFSGSAEASTKTFTGEVNKLALGFDDFKTSLGLIITQNAALRKAFQAMGTVFEFLTKKVDENKEAFGNLVTGGISLVVLSFEILVKSIRVLGAILSEVLNPFKKAVVTLAKGFETINFALRSVGRIVGLYNDVGDTLAVADNNLQILVDSFAQLDDIDNFSLEKSIDSLTQGALDGSQELQKAIDGIRDQKPIPINIVPTVVPGTKIDFSKADIQFPGVTGPDLSLPELSLPGAGPVTPTDAQTEAASKMLEAANKQQENQAAMASSIIGAVRTGGREGAVAIVGTAATAIAAAFGAGPFASVIGELVTLFTTDGLPKLITSLVAAVPEIIFTMAENIPLVAVALAEALGNPLFYIRVANALINGITTGLDKAFTASGEKISNLLSVPFQDFIDTISSAGLVFIEAIAVAGQDISDFFNAVFDVFVVLFDAASGGFATKITEAANVAGNQFAEFINTAGAQFYSFIFAAGDQFSGFASTAAGDISLAAVDFKNDIAAAFTDAKDQITGIFDEIGAAFNDFIDMITGGGARSEGTKAKGKLEATGGAIKGKVDATVSDAKDIKFGLAGDTGTIQRVPVPRAVSGTSGGGISNALLQRILVAVEKPVTIKSSISLDGRVFASVILDLVRRNVRLA